MERFSRTELLLGKKALACLHKANVLVVGLGAVGSLSTLTGIFGLTLAQLAIDQILGRSQ